MLPLWTPESTPVEEISFSGFQGCLGEKVHCLGKKYIAKVVDELTKNHRENDKEEEGGMMYETEGPFCRVASFEKYLQHLNPANEFLFLLYCIRHFRTNPRPLRYSSQFLTHSFTFLILFIPCSLMALNHKNSLIFSTNRNTTRTNPIPFQ